MIQTAVYDGALERFAGEIEEMIDSRGLSQFKGTGTLDDVQKQIDGMVSKHQNYISNPNASMDLVMNDFVKTKIRIELLLNEKVTNKSAGLGNVVPNVPITQDPEWSNVLKHAQRNLERFTTIYSAQISTLPSVEKKKLDFQLEDILLNIEGAFKRNPSQAAANAYMAHIDSIFAALEDRFSKYAQYTMQKSLGNLIERKSAERLSLASQLKMVDDKLSDNERMVVAKASSEIMRILTELKSDASSYNAAIRNQKLAVVDQHLATIRRVVDSLQFRDNLSGGQFMSAKRPRRSFYGFGDIPGKRYPSVRSGGGRPFLSAPSRIAAGGFGSLFPNATLDDPPQKVADILAENLQTAQAQGMLNQKDGAMLLRQVTMLTSGAFGGDVETLEQQKAYYRNQIEALMNNQSVYASNNQDKAGAILKSSITGDKQPSKTYTVYPTYGGYFTGYVLTPLAVMIALGGAYTLVQKSRGGAKAKKATTPRKSTNGKRKLKKKISGGLMGLKSSLKGKSFPKLKGNSLKQALGGLRGGRKA